MNLHASRSFRATIISVVAAVVIPAGASGESTFNGYYTYPYAPYVGLQWSSDFAPPPNPDVMLPEASGPFTGYEQAFVEGFGPGPASAFLSIDCPAPQQTPGAPTVVRLVYDIDNPSPVYGLFANGGTGVLRFELSGPVQVHYRLEWSFLYENFTGGSGGVTATIGHGEVWGSPSYEVVVVHDGPVVPSLTTGVIHGKVPSAGFVLQVNQIGYQGQQHAGHGVVTLEVRVFLDSSPIIGSADFNDDGAVDGDDLGALLGAWGECSNCFEDLNGDGVVDGDDLGTLLGAWSLPDSDMDGIPDAIDNCPDTPNADQLDSDRDGIGDACDPPDRVCSWPVVGDFDCDMDVDCDDFQVLLWVILALSRGECVEEVCMDLNHDGDLNLFDLALVESIAGLRCSGP